MNNAKFHGRQNVLSSKENIFKHYAQIYKRMFKTEGDYKAEFIDGKDEYFRNVIKGNSEKSPVLLTGCSFAYGVGLSDEETFAAKLSKLTGRTVYNRSLYGRGVNETFFQFNSEKF